MRKFFARLCKNQAQETEKDERSAEDILKADFHCYFDSGYSLKSFKTNSAPVINKQSEYERLGKVVHKYVQEILQRDFGLKEIWIPSESNLQCNIFVSRDWETNESKALILIQGAGKVRAGVWARSVCINESLLLGSMIPYVETALNQNFAVIILNPNYNKDLSGTRKIPSNEDSIAHCKYVWENFVRKSPAEHLCIVGHSCGGICTISLLSEYWEEFKRRVKAIALTDSVHGSCDRLKKVQKKYLKEKAVDWVACKEKLDTKVVSERENGCTKVSAGHSQHEYTSGFAYPSIFPYFKEMIENNLNTYIN